MTPRALYAPARLAGAPLLRTQTDERLVDLMRVGNDGAFEAIVARYRRPLLRYCSGLLPEGRAEDAVQQTFLRAYDALRASEGKMNLRPWLYRIAHNQSLNALRDRSLAHEELSESIDGVERPDQAFEKHERLRDTLAAVSALPERQRNAIVLRELEGRSYEEIATELGVTGGAVRALLNRARGTLRSGATALTPYGLMTRLPWAPPGAGEDMTTRVAEICGAGAGSAVVAKLCATALVTGAVLGGVATSPDGGPADGRADSNGGEAVAQTPDGPGGGEPVAAGGAAESGDDRGDRGQDGERDQRRGRGRGTGDEDEDNRGRGDDDEDQPDDDRSGRGGGEDDDDSRSGPGSGEAPAEDDGDSSGPGPGGGGSEPEDDRSGPGGGEDPEVELSDADDPPEPPELDE